MGKHTASNTSAPAYMTLGFAAYILFMKSNLVDGKYIGNISGGNHTITDDAAPVLNSYWQQAELVLVVNAVLKDTNLWDIDLTSLVGFEEAVALQLNLLIVKGFKAAVTSI